MKSICFTLVILCAVAFDKYERDRNQKVPAAIEHKIDQLKERSVKSQSAEVHEYLWKVRTVYCFINRDSCDKLYDVSGYCIDSFSKQIPADVSKWQYFNSQAKEVRTVWNE